MIELRNVKFSRSISILPLYSCLTYQFNYTAVNIGCFDVADISAILTNFVSIISSVPEYG